MELKSLVEEFSKLKSEKDLLEEQLSNINKRIEILARQEIPNAMDEAGIHNVNFEGIGRISLRADVFASISSDNKEAAYEWLEATGRGSLIKPTVNSSTLRAAIKAWILEGEEIPEDLFKVTPYTQATLTRA